MRRMKKREEKNDFFFDYIKLHTYLPSTYIDKSDDKSLQELTFRL